MAISFMKGKVVCVQYTDFWGVFSLYDPASRATRPFILWYGDEHSEGPIAIYVMHLTVALTRGLDVTVAFDLGASTIRSMRVDAP